MPAATQAPPGSAAATPDAAAGSAAGSVISAMPLPWAALRGPKIDLTATVASMTLGQQVWHNAEFVLQLEDGRLRLPRFGLSLPAGPVEGSLTADASADHVPVSLALHAPGIPLALLARYAKLPGQTTGALRVDTQLHATGRSVHDLAATLNGRFAATMTGGSLSNAALISIASASLEALNIKVPAEGETAIRCFALVGSFSNGDGRFRTIVLDTTHLQLDGTGQVDLGTETLLLKLYPLARLSSALVAVPVLVDGPFRSVSGRLDASGLDKAGLLIDALLGGDQPNTCADAGLAPAPNEVR